jgi:tRNA(Ile)-lysidine synthase
VLLAVSGGIDSMVMTHLFIKADYNIGIAHCNFSLRGAESDKDEEMVRDFAAANNIPFYSKRFDTKAYSEIKRLSVQMAARELRYTWFEEVRMENNFDLIAVAHNVNDNIETLLINLTRGTGIAGLTGISISQNRIIRPLMFATRQEIVDYAGKNNVYYREDKSNSETKYVRNKIRHKIIPVLKEINPSIENTLIETAERISEVSELVSEYIKTLTDKVCIKKGKNIIFNINLLKKYKHNKTVIYELFRPYGISGVLVNDLLQIIDGRTGSQIFSPDYRIVKNRLELIITPRQEEEDEFYEIANLEEFRKVPRIKSASYFNITSGYTIPSSTRFACLDSENISFPLVVRRWKSGDFFYPLGMRKRKKLSDYFIDKKYSITEKEKTLVLESKGDIVWIIGERIDDRFRITENTRSVLVLEA